MNTVPHFCSEDVGRVCHAGNVLNRNCVVLNPFPKRIFTQLNVASRLRSHVVRPLDTSFIVVVDKSRVLKIRDRETGLSDTPADVSEVDYLFRSGARGANLGLTRTEGGSFLPFAEPA
jgi:hypothetical protein